MRKINVFDDILICFKEICSLLSRNRGSSHWNQVVTEKRQSSDFKIKMCSNTIPSVFVPAKIGGQTNTCLYQMSMCPSRYLKHTAVPVWPRNVTSACDCRAVCDCSRSGHADSSDVENPAFGVNGSCKRWNTCERCQLTTICLGEQNPLAKSEKAREGAVFVC